MPEPKTYRLVAELARLEDGAAVDNILDTHVDDGHGKCPACHLDDKLRQPWPCSLWYFAARARDIRQQLRAG